MNYPYASGNISALESKILDANKLFVLNKYDKSEFVKVLLSMNYGDNGSTIEELISNEMNKVKKLLDELTPSVRDTDLFYLVNDAQNIKILYKIKKFNLDKFDLLLNNGSIDIDLLKRAIIDNDYTGLNNIKKGLFIILEKKLEEVTNPKILSFIIDREIYLYALKEANSKILETYIKCKIDLTNIISMIRSRNLNWSKEYFFETFIDSKTMDKDLFDRLYNESYEVICKEFEPFYEEKVSRIMRNNLTKGNFNKIDIDFERLSLEIVKPLSDDMFTVGPMFYYYLLKKAEAQNIRTLYSGKNKDIEIKDLI